MLAAPFVADRAMDLLAKKYIAKQHARWLP